MNIAWIEQLIGQACAALRIDRERVDWSWDESYSTARIRLRLATSSETEALSRWMGVHGSFSVDVEASA